VVGGEEEIDRFEGKTLGLGVEEVDGREERGVDTSEDLGRVSCDSRL
jgi:hypothetical protein